MIERPNVPPEGDDRPTAAAFATDASRGEGLGGAQTGGLSDPRALQILSIEHSNLVATRSMLWSESFARAALFVSVLSASVVALSLIGTSRPDFRTFALILLPVALFVGIGTFVRLDDSNREEALWVVAMNRLRHAYVAMVPGLADRFVSGTTDDFAGIVRSYGRDPGTHYSFLHFFVTIPGTVAVVDGVIAGVIAAEAFEPLAWPALVEAAAALAIGFGVTTALGLRSKRHFDALVAANPPKFGGTPPSGGAGQ
jgi:hypothetical protein